MSGAADYKTREVEKLTSMMDEASVVSLVAVDGIPGPQLQDMRGMLRGRATMRVTKQTFLKLAMERSSKGKPNLETRIDGGVHGDIATCAITLNCVDRVIQAEPGLKTMVDLPPASFSWK